MKLDDARILARLWMEQHGLGDWSFEFDSALRRFGCCVRGRRLITMSRVLVELNDEAEVEDTILHEIAHALAPRGCIHGLEWQRIAKQIGARPERCSGDHAQIPALTQTHLWIGSCPNCGLAWRRFRRRKSSCGRCSQGQYNEKYLLVWRKTAPVQP